MRHWMCVVAALLVGCADGGSLGGDENGVFLDAGDEFSVAEPDVPPAGIDTDDDGLRDAMFSAECMPPGSTVSDPPLQATTGPNSVTCVHEGIEAPIDPGWLVSGMVNEGNSIDMTYETSNDGGETCIWRLTYTVEGLAPGEWTLNAVGDSLSFTIAE